MNKNKNKNNKQHAIGVDVCALRVPEKLFERNPVEHDHTNGNTNDEFEAACLFPADRGNGNGNGNGNQGRGGARGAPVEQQIRGASSAS